MYLRCLRWLNFVDSSKGLFKNVIYVRALRVILLQLIVILR